ncbi:hypothetical protein L210DRAFT_3505252 [Boletus edulis BED1]|uniref:Uncharacterized protein n=1 Tax=Boletus edulis BED1 TaxID=1328754 RepID=A0AAD4BR20_BOLED|nr:hypothetical protein L210DRAFT_3505252 [Boletus edulis BED1]
MSALSYPEPAFEFLQKVDYTALLTLSREIDYVWVMTQHSLSNLQAPDSMIAQTLELDLHNVSFDSLFWSFSCHFNNSYGHFKGTVTHVVVFWQLPIFIAAADCIHVYSHPHGPLSSRVNQVPGFSTCDHSLSTSSPVLYFYLLGLRATISIMLLGLAAIQTLKQSVEMYQVTKQWKPNQYMQLLVKDGILYFVVVREFHDHKHHGQWEGIDAGFGASLHLISGENAVVSAVAIADATVNQVMEGEADESEGIQLEMRGDNIHQA